MNHRRLFGVLRRMVCCFVLVVPVSLMAGEETPSQQVAGGLQVVAPEKGRPGELVRIAVRDPGASTWNTRYRCGARIIGPYLPVNVIKRSGEKPDPTALSNAYCNELQFSLPPEAIRDGAVIWIRTEAATLQMTLFHAGKQVSQHWLNRSAQSSRWIRGNSYIRPGIADTGVIRIHSGGGIDCAILTPDVDYNPEFAGSSLPLDTANIAFSLTLPSFLPEAISYEVSAERTLLSFDAAPTAVASAKRSRAVSINVSDPVVTAKPPLFSPDRVQWLSLHGAANLAALAEPPLPQLLDQETAKQGAIAYQGVKIPFAPTGACFIGVWKPVGKEELGKRVAEVAQADDKIQKAIPLPESVTLPVGKPCAELVFIQAESGAGEIGELVWDYVVTYADGTQQTIPIREATEVSGMLKDEKTLNAELIHEQLVRGVPQKVYAYSWRNPRLDETIATIQMRSRREKVIPVLLAVGLISPGQPQSTRQVATASVPEDTNAVLAEANFSSPVRPVRRGLFAMNNPYLNNNSPYLCLSADSWRVYAQMNPEYDRIWAGGAFPKTPEGSLTVSPEFLTTDHAIKRMGALSTTRLIVNLNPPKWAWDEGEDLEKRCARAAELSVAILRRCREHHWPVTYVEIFNEVLINHPRAETERRYRCFNAIAAALKQAFPEILITGTAECWPAVGVIEDFVRNCNAHLDAVSWHLYPTGKIDSPTEALMQHTAQFAEASRRIDRMLRQTVPQRRIGQLVTEYNINYAAWKGNGESRQGNGIGAVWLLSVMRHLLYDGEVEIANYWHYAFGGGYGIGASPQRLSPMGALLVVLNQEARGDLCAAGTSSAGVDCLAVRGEKGRILALTNTTASEKSLKLRLESFLPIAKGTGAQTLTLYEVEGEEKIMRCSLIPAVTFSQEEVELQLPRYSMKLYVVHAE